MIIGVVKELTVRANARLNAAATPGRLKGSQIESLGRQARFEVVNGIVHDVGALFRLPLQLDAERFHEHYQSRLALPLTIATHLDQRQIALFEERSLTTPGLNLDTTPVRFYPHGVATGHLLGYLKRDNSSAYDEEAFFNYRLPDFRGAVGIELGRIQVAVAVDQLHRGGPFRSAQRVRSSGSSGAPGSLRRFQLASSRVARPKASSSTNGIGSGSTRFTANSAAVSLNKVGKRRPRAHCMNVSRNGLGIVGCARAGARAKANMPGTGAWHGGPRVHSGSCSGLP